MCRNNLSACCLCSKLSHSSQTKYQAARRSFLIRDSQKMEWQVCRSIFHTSFPLPYITFGLYRNGNACYVGKFACRFACSRVIHTREWPLACGLTRLDKVSQAKVGAATESWREECGLVFLAGFAGLLPLTTILQLNKWACLQGKWPLKNPTNVFIYRF